MVDQNLGPSFAAVLNALCEPPHSAHHISTLGHLGLSSHSTDMEWMRVLAKDQESWAVFTTDRGIIRNPELSRELSQSGVTYFIAMKNWKGVPIHERIARIARLWPRIMEFALLPNPAVYKISPAIQKIERASWTRSHSSW